MRFEPVAPFVVNEGLPAGPVACIRSFGVAEVFERVASVRNSSCSAVASVLLPVIDPVRALAVASVSIAEVAAYAALVQAGIPAWVAAASLAASEYPWEPERAHEEVEAYDGNDANGWKLPGRVHCGIEVSQRPETPFDPVETLVGRVEAEESRRFAGRSEMGILGVGREVIELCAMRRTQDEVRDVEGRWRVAESAASAFVNSDSAVEVATWSEKNRGEAEVHGAAALAVRFGQHFGRMASFHSAAQTSSSCVDETPSFVAVVAVDSSP